MPSPQTDAPKQRRLDKGRNVWRPASNVTDLTLDVTPPATLTVEEVNSLHGENTRLRIELSKAKADLEKQVLIPVPHGVDIRNVTVCPNCSGNGWSNPTTRCPTCGGQGCLINAIPNPVNQTPIKDVNNTYGPGTFGCHEAMHTASIALDMVDSNLRDHPAVQQNETWMRLANDACKALFDLYQAIGIIHLKNDVKPLRD